jgi:hypothetical protein
MSIQLTPQQQQALDTQEDSPPRVIDPRTNTSYILVREVDYESVRELFEDERRQQLNRGRYALSARPRFAVRSKLSNCVPCAMREHALH